MVKIIPNVKEYGLDLPMQFENNLQYWGFFSREELEQNKGKLLMLDIDFGRYCSLSCPSCFRKSSVVDDIDEGDLTYDELIGVIDEAKELGLQSVKICGVGEPTENKRFLEFIRDLTDRDVGVAVFTKGQVLGSDDAALHFNLRYGLHGLFSAQGLCEQLYDLKVSFMLSFQSFDTNIQDEMVGKSGHTLVRNRALENLVNVGFNKTNPTRLALTSAPVLKENYNEVFEIYVYARQRNIYPVATALMTSGKQIDKAFLQKYDICDGEKIDLWTKIYSWNIENGIQTFKQIKEDGVSALAGVHPCNQVAAGLYVTIKGNVVGCPGFTEIEGNVRNESIREIWERSNNKKLRSGVFNCKCPPKDGITIPDGFYDKVLNNLEKKYR